MARASGPRPGRLRRTTSVSASCIAGEHRREDRPPPPATRAGRATPWKVAARARKTSDAKQQPERAEPERPRQHDVGEEPEREHRPERRRRRAGGSPRRRRGSRARSGATHAAAGRERDQRRHDRDDAEAERAAPSRPTAGRRRGGLIAAASAGRLGPRRAAAGRSGRPGPRSAPARHRADHPHEVEPAVVGGEADPLPAVGADDHLADQDVGRVEPAVAGADHPVAGAQLVAPGRRTRAPAPGRCRRRRSRAGPRGARSPGTRLERVGEEDDPRRALADAGDPADEPEPVDHRRAVGDAVDARRR